MAKENLKPCPFCGGKGRIECKMTRYYFMMKTRIEYFVCCNSCASEGGWAKHEGNAIKNWNMRVGINNED